MHRRIGYCPENPYFYDYLTALEVLNYFGELFGYDRATRGRKAAELLTAAGLPEKDWKKQLRKYSKGMLQRVGLAQSLLNDPEIVFLDEPMSGLDPVGRREIRELIAGLREKGTTVFMSTHILSDIEALCDEVAILRGGKLAATGRLSELLDASDSTSALEMNIEGITADAVRDDIDFIAGAEILPRPGGVTVRIIDETDIDAVLRVTRLAGGRLASVTPARQSLEDLFVRETRAAVQQQVS
jgi:ABC-2 type transport system ATP-binding protein